MSKIPGKTLLDPWGNRFNVAVRYYENKQLEFLVWSKGPDGVNGTEDDFISANIENGVTKIKNHVQFFR